MIDHISKNTDGYMVTLIDKKSFWSHQDSNTGAFGGKSFEDAINGIIKGQGFRLI